MWGWITVCVVIAVLVVGGAIGWSFLSKEHREARNVPIAAIDFTKLNDGIYTGAYEGGMYKWRANQVKVTVASGKVEKIESSSSSEAGAGNTVQSSLYKKVIDAQSLQVDAISGATLTSKAYLKAVEDALTQAQKQ